MILIVVPLKYMIITWDTKRGRASEKQPPQNDCLQKNGNTTETFLLTCKLVMSFCLCRWRCAVFIVTSFLALSLAVCRFYSHVVFGVVVNGMPFFVSICFNVVYAPMSFAACRFSTVSLINLFFS